MQPKQPSNPNGRTPSLSGQQISLKESPFYESTSKGVHCLICPNNCVLREGIKGICRTHVARENKLYMIGYGNPCSVHIDPIEKKPLFHYLPASACLSIATSGCNLACQNCQNWEISQRGPEATDNHDLYPQQVVEAAVKHGCQSIAYTYTEPTVFYKYMLDTAVIARSRGIRNLMISNGYINEKPLRELSKTLDAANIDLKSFSAETYEKLFRGRLQPVLDTLLVLREEEVWLEITNLLIPGLTDQPDLLRQMCGWLVSHGFSGTPLHFSRFHPMHKLTGTPVTPLNTLETARKIALNAGIRYVYIGNVPGSDAENTFCPGCSKTVIERYGFTIAKNDVVNGACRFCGAKIEGVWS